MNGRYLFVGCATAALLYGCAQSTAPMPVIEPQGARVASHPLSSGPQAQFFNLLAGPSWPEYIVSGPGRAMWFTEFFGSAIGRITMDGTITNFTVPGGDAEGITIGADRNIWFTEPGYQWIGRLTPTGKATIFQLPNA